MPHQWPVDPSAVFEGGMIGQLGIMGNNIICGVSDGSMPIGIIDDIKTTAFTAPAIDEEVIVSAVGVDNGVGTLVSPNDIVAFLDNPNVSASSFVSNPVSVALNTRNGAITFLAGTPLNFDADGDSIPDSIRTVVSYTYQVPNIVGDDSTQASGRVTIWYQKMIAETDKFETNQRYPLNAPLFVSEAGLLTTRQVDPDYPCVAIVTATPNSIMGTLQFMWL